MTLMTGEATLGRRAPESLIPATLFSRLVGRIVRDANVDRQLAERIMRQALAFLLACARNPDTPLAPSRTVDKGWHAFILHTREYADFCQDVAGRFIHHAPDDEPDGDRIDTAARTEMTVDVMRQTGLPVDEELWSGHQASCSSKCQGCCSDHP
ncbi:MAG: hypothetical protein JWR24_5244 [Actinoallomurus sp.]|jgi:hypothetical protein|nr:hypothetical protein [Actinoallomurus sp.]